MFLLKKNLVVLNSVNRESCYTWARLQNSTMSASFSWIHRAAVRKVMQDTIFSRIHTCTFTWAFIHRNHRVQSVSMEIIWISSSIFDLLIISLNDFTSWVLHFFFIIGESKFDVEKIHITENLHCNNSRA